MLFRSDVLICFATNLNPESLADEAFLRRIPYKIPIVDPTLDEFTRIFELNCRRRNLRFHQVLVAYLQRRIRLVPTSDKPPAQQILDDFERLERAFSSQGFRGCAFVNAVAELKDPKHAANQIALAFKDMRRQWFRELLGRAGVADPDAFARQWHILMKGSIVAAAEGDHLAARRAQEIGKLLLDQAHPSHVTTNNHQASTP